MSAIIDAALLDGRGGGELIDRDGGERWTATAGALWIGLFRRWRWL